MAPRLQFGKEEGGTGSVLYAIPCMFSEAKQLETRQTLTAAELTLEWEAQGMETETESIQGCIMT